jgi:GNAT superfamily N-acetyltransferase
MTCYAPLVASDPAFWGPEVKNWERFDDDVYQNIETIGDCTLLTWQNEHLIGFASFDPRPQPDYGIIGHNCILPEFQNQGAGKAQICEILRRLQQRRIQAAHVSTLDHAFFLPARRMYLACGFHISTRQPWKSLPDLDLISYKRTLEDAK